MRGGWVYLMANRYRGTIYTGVTADLSRRTWQHKHGEGSAFARKYGVTHLVYVEPFERIEDDIGRKKAIKKWLRSWKIELIENENPNWKDLFEHVIGA